MTKAGQTRDLLVGVDVGGSKIAVLVVDRAFAVRARHTIPTAVGAPDGAAAHIGEAVEAALASAGAGIARVAAIGVGVPGRVDPIQGEVSLAVNLGWHRLQLGPQLEGRLGVPCVIENDVRAAAVGILERRLLGDVADFVYLAVGTGISAGVVIGNRVHRGTRGLAGEIGHIVVDADGQRCTCGLRGCLETIAAGPAIARAAVEAIQGGRGSVLAASDDIDAAAVYRAAADGDELAGEIVARAGTSLARAIHALVMTYDVERVVLGGGVSRAGEGFIAPIRAELEAMRASSELAAEMLPPGVVAISPDGPDAGAWGGVSIARTLAGHAGPAGVGGVEEVVARQATA
ncbi:MAG TPA: ROK family protein [Candidatus Limnocylindrales bacterium]|nr:ROK family protein [Candidatus Limnocylindrales bacterium]